MNNIPSESIRIYPFSEPRATDPWGNSFIEHNITNIVRSTTDYSSYVLDYSYRFGSDQTGKILKFVIGGYIVEADISKFPSDYEPSVHHLVAVADIQHVQPTTRVSNPNLPAEYLTLDPEDDVDSGTFKGITFEFLTTAPENIRFASTRITENGLLYTTEKLYVLNTENQVPDDAWIRYKRKTMERTCWNRYLDTRILIGTYNLNGQTLGDVGIDNVAYEIMNAPVKRGYSSGSLDLVCLQGVKEDEYSKLCEKLTGVYTSALYNDGFTLEGVSDKLKCSVGLLYKTSTVETVSGLANYSTVPGVFTSTVQLKGNGSDTTKSFGMLLCRMQDSGTDRQNLANLLSGNTYSIACGVFATSTYSEFKPPIRNTNEKLLYTTVDQKSCPDTILYNSNMWTLGNFHRGSTKGVETSTDTLGHILCFAPLLMR